MPPKYKVETIVVIKVKIYEGGMKMEEKTKKTIEEIAKQQERRVHYHIHRLSLRDPHEEFLQEGLVAMWNAYEKHEPDKGPLATYFNYTIRNRLIDLIRKKAREQQNDELF